MRGRLKMKHTSSFFLRQAMDKLRQKSSVFTESEIYPRRWHCKLKGTYVSISLLKL